MISANRRPDHRGGDQRRDGKPGGFKGGKPGFDRSFLDQKPKQTDSPIPIPPSPSFSPSRTSLKARNRRRVGWFTPEGAILRGKKTGGWAPLRRQRLDVWIWFARFLRTRAACAALVRTGHVRINGRRVNAPGTPLRKGDILTLALPGRTIVVNVVDFAERRGDAQAASHLYLPVPGMILPLLAKHLLPPVDEAAHLSPFIADDDADGQMRLRKQRVESRSRRIWPLKRGRM